MRHDPHQVYPHTRRQTLTVGESVERIQQVLGAQIIALIGLDDDGHVFITCQPGHDAQTLRVMAGLDWRGAQMIAEEMLD